MWTSRALVDDVVLDPGLDARPTGRTPVIRAGKYSTELAKMIGMTPDWLTLSGM